MCEVEDMRWAGRQRQGFRCRVIVAKGVTFRAH